MNMKTNNLVIMAGGIGSIFWPMSTVETPKQFLDILGTSRTLLQLTADRFKDTVNSSNIWLVISVKSKDLVASLLPDIPKQQTPLEPLTRNTLGKASNIIV